MDKNIRVRSSRLKEALKDGGPKLQARKLAKVVIEERPQDRPTASRGSLFVELPYPPTANTIWRHGKGARPILAQSSRDYRDSVRAIFIALKLTPAPAGARVSVAISFYRPRKTGDLDNRLKPLLDSLRGLAYQDDSQVLKLVADMQYDPKNPRAEVAISWKLGESEEGVSDG